MYATLLMGPDAKDKAEKALAAYDAKNMARFNNLADSLENRSVIEELDLAGRCENCDWEFPWHEEGLGTLLPQLSPASEQLRQDSQSPRGSGRSIRARSTLPSRRYGSDTKWRTRWGKKGFWFAA